MSLRSFCGRSFPAAPGIKRINVRTKWKAEPDNIPKKAETMAFVCDHEPGKPESAGTAPRNAGRGRNRPRHDARNHRSADELFRAGRRGHGRQAQGRASGFAEPGGLFREGVAFVRGGNVTTMPELVAFGWRPRADMTLTFRRAPKKSFGTVEIPAESPSEGTVNIRHAKEAETGFRVNR